MRNPVQLTKSVGSASLSILYVAQRASMERLALISPAGRPRPQSPPPMAAPTLSSFWRSVHEVRCLRYSYEATDGPLGSTILVGTHPGYRSRYAVCVVTQHTI